MVLSVVVRSGPVRTAVNGTLVARPTRVSAVQPSAGRHQLVRRTKIVLGNCLASSSVGARQLSVGFQAATTRGRRPRS